MFITLLEKYIIYIEPDAKSCLWWRMSKQVHKRDAWLIGAFNWRRVGHTNKRRLSLAQDFTGGLHRLDARPALPFSWLAAAFRDERISRARKRSPRFWGGMLTRGLVCIFRLLSFYVRAGMYLCAVHAVLRLCSPRLRALMCWFLGECAFRFRLAGHVVCF